MLNIGYHESISGGWENLVTAALEAGGRTFAFFTRNPRAAFSDKILINDKIKDDLSTLNKKMKENNFSPVVAHAPYTANPCSEDETKRLKAWDLIKSDAAFMAKYLPGNFYNLHPGSPKSLGSDAGIQFTGEILKEIERKRLENDDNNSGCTLLIETMAGKGSEIGRTFEELRAIIDFAGGEASGVGVCFDTCHVWDAGYDIKNNLDEVLIKFDNVVGLGKIKAIHLNDSKNPCGARKDRHELIGAGFIGFAALARVINHPAFEGLPVILETPNVPSGYKSEIAALKAAYNA